MTRYLVSFDASAMDHIPDEGMPVAVPKRYGSSCPTPNLTRCTARTC